MKAVMSLVLTLTVMGLAIEAAVRFGRMEAWGTVVVSLFVVALAQYGEGDKDGAA